MRLITYDIHLLEPLLVTALDGDPNSSISYDFIPGSVLRGALIGRYQNAGNEIDSITLRSLFFSPDTQYLNGYRTLYDEVAFEEVRSWPLPLSLRREEAREEEEKSFKVHDLAWTSAEDTERLSTPFGILDNGGQTAPIDRQVTTHIQRDRRVGRSTRESGEIYNYEALSAGQTFRAHILTTLTEIEIQPVINLLSGELHLGGSRSAGYGRVHFELIENPPDLKTWLAQRYPAQKPAGKVAITLLSDLLLRDENGNWTTDPRIAARSVGLELDTAFRAVRPIGAFNL
jgi:CRISPR-associated protein Csx10